MSTNQRPKRTNRLVVDVNEGIMARVKTYLLQVAQTDFPMTMRVLVESALCDYLDGKASQEKEMFFTFMKNIRDDQYNMQKTMDSLVEGLGALSESLTLNPNSLPVEPRTASDSWREDPDIAALTKRWMSDY